ncbi:MAG TPA: 2-oxo acid dehydrogenase subunit E2 [Nocardioides sp.]|uniref:2-oxo acid dehydrogenase subunit E2 n=1 Tax=Nocardioides sp. TaxID=35761 RepID=UPI002E37D902|nr:2-oxo acid dehydrogenase subunit E2 [Nocardioides sp.]HEX3930164.1 2-oxo acid dehydrogenase subunit E2 [Nocardioides sp.]
MPEVADDPTVATLTAWLVRESGDFAGAQSIATVETDTSLVSIEVAEPGVLIKPLVEPGDRVQPGAPLAVLGAPGEVIGDVEQLMVELGLAVAPESTDAQVHLRPVRPGDPLYATTWPPLEATPDGKVLAEQPPAAEATIAETPIAETPIAVDTDPDEAQKQAVVAQVATERAADERAHADESPVAEAVTAELPAAEELVAAASTDPLGHPVVIRKMVDWADTVAEAVLGAVLSSDARPTAGTPVAAPRQVQVRELVRADQLSAVFTEVETVSLISLVVKAVALTSRRLPLRTDVPSPSDVALLRWTDAGPVAPVVRVANLMTVSSLTTTLADVDARARAGRLASAELEPAAVTIVDLGADGAGEAVLDATAGHPAILTVGALREQPVVENGAVVPGTVMTLVLACDASRIGGTVAARWLAHLARLLEQPLLFLT